MTDQTDADRSLAYFLERKNHPAGNPSLAAQLCMEFIMELDDTLEKMLTSASHEAGPFLWPGIKKALRDDLVASIEAALNVPGQRGRHCQAAKAR